MNAPARLLLLFAAPLFLLPVSAPAQDSLRVLILSPRLGPVITPAHRERFRIFQQIERFQSAVMCQSKSGSFYAWIESLLPSGDVKRELRPYSYAALRMTAEKVDHYDEIIDGSYTIGSAPVQLLYADSATAAKMPVKPPATLQAAEFATGRDRLVAPPPPAKRSSREAEELLQKDLLPFANVMDENPFQRFPVLRFGVGISSFSWDGAEVQELLNLLRERYLSEGYAVFRSEFRGIGDPMLSFSVNLMVTPSWGVTLEAGKAEDEDEGASFTLASLSVCYRPVWGISSFVRPYAALGAAYYHLNLNKKFTPYARISPIDSNGAYYRLDEIGLSGNDGGYGGVATLGFEFLLPPDVDVFVRYMFGPELQIASSWGGPRKISAGGLSYGIRAMIRF